MSNSQQLCSVYYTPSLVTFCQIWTMYFIVFIVKELFHQPWLQRWVSMPPELTFSPYLTWHQSWRVTANFKTSRILSPFNVIRYWCFEFGSCNHHFPITGEAYTVSIWKLENEAEQTTVTYYSLKTVQHTPLDKKQYLYRTKKSYRQANVHSKINIPWRHLN